VSGTRDGGGDARRSMRARPRSAALPGARLLVSVVLRTALVSLSWWAFVEGDLQSPWLAAAVVALTVASSYAVITPGTIGIPHPVGLGRFLAFFVVQSLAGGIDVLRRAVLPGRTVEPRLVEIALRVPAGVPQLMVAGVASLLPGTLSTELDEGRLVLHVLDHRIDGVPKVRALEDRVAAMLRLGRLVPERDLPMPRVAGDGSGGAG
jgi:multicomponent Na+:H+ antiporter subunit E